MKRRCLRYGAYRLLNISRSIFPFNRVEFTVGAEPVNNFRMIERHYFRDKLLKSFDFEFGFCIPNSKNTCEHIYEFPTLTSAESKLCLCTMFRCGELCGAVKRSKHDTQMKLR